MMSPGTITRQRQTSTERAAAALERPFKARSILTWSGKNRIASTRPQKIAE